MLNSRSICSARRISLILREKLRSLVRKKFFATCMVMVLPPVWMCPLFNICVAARIKLVRSTP
ncbi:hypothetical protein D3C71_2190350 [compost metagenome]